MQSKTILLFVFLYLLFCVVCGYMFGGCTTENTGLSVPVKAIPDSVSVSVLVLQSDSLSDPISAGLACGFFPQWNLDHYPLPDSVRVCIGDTLWVNAWIPDSVCVVGTCTMVGSGWGCNNSYIIFSDTIIYF